MKAFAHLLERLAFTPARNAKLRLLRHYLETTPDPDRGYALAALTGDLKLRAVTPSLLRGLMAERVDDQLFALSYDFVGDLAETIALLWQGDGDQDVPLHEAVTLLFPPLPPRSPRSPRRAAASCRPASGSSRRLCSRCYCCCS